MIHANRMHQSISLALPRWLAQYGQYSALNIDRYFPRPDYHPICTYPASHWVDPEVWLEFSNFVTLLPRSPYSYPLALILLCREIVEEHLRSPLDDFVLFDQVRVEARQCYNNITSIQISWIEDLNQACSLLFHGNCDKPCNGTANRCKCSSHIDITVPHCMTVINDL